MTDKELDSLIEYNIKKCKILLKHFDVKNIDVDTFVKKMAFWYEITNMNLTDSNRSESLQNLEYNILLNSLPSEERWLLSDPVYNSLVYLDNMHTAHFHLNEKGYIEDAENLSVLKNSRNMRLKVTEKDLIGRHIKDAYMYLSTICGYRFKDNSDVKRLVDNTSLKEDLIQAFNEAVIYTIQKKNQTIAEIIASQKGLEFKQNKPEILIRKM